MALFCVVSANSGIFRAHCVKVHVRYLIYWWVLVLFLVVLVWNGYMPAPRFTICVLVIIEFGLNILGNPVTSLTLFVLKIDCSVFKVTVTELTVTSFKNIVAYRKKRLNPSLGNSNVHRRRNLDRERPASEIVSYRARVKYACARIHCKSFIYYRIRGNPLHGIPWRLYLC